MKHLLILLILINYVTAHGFAQSSADAIIGNWLKLPKKDMIIEVYKTKEVYYGKISWAEAADKPQGFVIIKDLKYNNHSGKWEGGKIYDPSSSRVFKAEVKLNPEGNLVVKGYKGMKFMSSSRTFMRVKS